MRGFLAFLKRNSEAIFIGAAVALFAVGLATFLLRRGEAERGDGTGPPRGAIGPSPGEPLPAYIEARKGELTKRAQSQPKARSFAVISFGAYMKPSQIDALLATHKLAGAQAQWRLPLPGEPAQAIEVESTVADAIGKAVTAATAELAARAQDLDNYAKEAVLAEERAQFAEDARGARQLVDALKSDPAIVHAVVVRGSNAALLQVSNSPEVRLVDIGDPGAGPTTHTFAGLRPEQTDIG